MTRTTDIDLLPLPEGESSSFGNYEVHDNEAMIEYARANVAHATASLQAEVERLRAEVERLNSYYKNGIECFANPCERHSGERTPPFAEFFEKYGGLCLICVVDNNRDLQAENERLRIVMDAMQGANDALLAAGEDHDDFEAMVARIILDRDALRQRVASAEATLNDLIRDAHERVYDWQSSGVDDEAELWRRTELAYRQALALLSGAAPK